MSELFDIEETEDGVAFPITRAQEPLAVYALTVYGPKHSLHQHGLKYEAIGIPDSYLRETAENLTDLLPDGYTVKIYKQ